MVKNLTYDTAVFSAPFSINNEPFYMAAVVIVDDKVNEYYLHEVVIKKQNEDETPFKTGTSQKTTPSDASSSIYTLLEKLQNVNKQFSKNTVLDTEYENGTEQEKEKIIQNLAMKWGAYSVDGKVISRYRKLWVHRI